MGDYLINIYFLPFLVKNRSVVMWGIGTSSSRGLGLESRFSIFLRNLVTIFYRGLALYSSFPINNYWIVNKNKISIVGNSIFNKSYFNSSDKCKKYFLFIGSLDRRKGINELLFSLAAAKRVFPNLNLKIVGDGPDRLVIEEKILELDLKNNVQMLGAIYESSEKRRIFESAYCVISPFQAGLSVVEAFSYGVPYVTSYTAITGGESKSIINEVNGVIFERIEELSDIIVSFVDGRRSSKFLGNNAFKFYKENLTFDLYVKRFKEFIEKYSQ